MGRRKVREDDGHKYQICVPKELWEAFKETCNKNQTYTEIINQLIKERVGKFRKPSA